MSGESAEERALEAAGRYDANRAELKQLEGRLNRAHFLGERLEFRRLGGERELLVRRSTELWATYRDAVEALRHERDT